MNNKVGHHLKVQSSNHNGIIVFEIAILFQFLFSVNVWVVFKNTLLVGSEDFCFHMSIQCLCFLDRKKSWWRNRVREYSSTGNLL